MDLDEPDFDLLPEDDDEGFFQQEEYPDEYPDDEAPDEAPATPKKEPVKLDEEVKPEEEKPAVKEEAEERWVRRLDAVLKQEPRTVLRRTVSSPKAWRDEEVVIIDEPPAARTTGAAAVKQEALDREARRLKEYLLTRPPLDEDSVSMVFDDGALFHVVVGAETADPPSLPPPGQLLCQSVEEMRSETPKARKEVFAVTDDGKLWVDKYAPFKFQDLLSDERVNRDVMRHIKNWDPFVFGRPAPKPPKAVVPSWKKKKQFSSTNYPKLVAERRKKPFVEHAEDPVLGSDKRPLKRIILLAGDPGTGKTTLARVLADLAGYRVVDVNASDERTADALERAVGDAQTNRSIEVGGMSTKPACVVLDEIDGANGKAAVAAVVAMASAQLPTTTSSSNKDDESESDESEDDDDDDDTPKRHKKKRRGKSSLPASKRRKSSSKKKKQFALTRPVICICNDPYAPHLRQLREISAFVHLKQPPSAQRLVTRLKAVAVTEGIGGVSSAALTSLADAARGDIRACLHVFQFAAKSREPAIVNAAIFKAVESGAVRDRIEHDLDAWRAVFKRKTVRRRRRSEDGTPPEPQNDRAQLGGLLQMAAGIEAPRFCAGVQENYASVIENDASLARIAAVADDLSQADIFLGAGLHGGRYEFQHYASATACATAFTRCRVDAPPRMRPPPYAATRANEANLAALNALDDARAQWRSRALARSQPRLGHAIIALDVAPLLRRLVLDAKLRPVGLELLRPPEKAVVDSLAAVMAANGLTFERADADTWHLRPDLAAATCFDEQQTATLAPVTCQLLAREVLLAGVRNKDANKENSDAAQHKLPQPKKRPADLIADQARRNPTPSTTKHFAFDTWVVKPKGGDAETDDQQPPAKLQKALPPKPIITFKFRKGGGTSAIRRPCTLSDLVPGIFADDDAAAQSPQ